MKWYQLHLSTLLLLTVLAGAFLWLNLRVRRVDDFLGTMDVFGWPFVVQQRKPFRTKPSDAETTFYVYASGHRYSSKPQFRKSAIVLNVFVGLAGLALAGYVSEKIIRRKKSV